MILFLDTEFTDFLDTQLISIGLVSLEYDFDKKFKDQQEHFFYRELNDFDQKACSPFVREAVLPLLDNKNPLNTAQVKYQLEAFLLAKIGDNDQITIAYDYSGDKYLLVEVLNFGWESPLCQRIDWYNLMENRRTGQGVSFLKLETFFDNFFVQRHHALNDAMALRWSYFVE